MNTNCSLQFAWLAGVMDGEGCFYAGHNTNGGGICCQVSFGTKDEVFMQAVLKVLALLDLAPRVTRYNTKGGCAMKAIHIGKSAEICRLVKAILPHLILKKPQAGILEVLCTRKQERHRQKPLSTDWRMVDLVRSLNQRKTTLSHTPIFGEGAETISSPERDGIVQPAR